ncbi:uncharacterized protein TNCV_1649921 [Trichonephila clavipes]|nr:uncharacterized protein TNCV_1649921 [Trichonephila clavipes]
MDSFLANIWLVIPVERFWKLVESMLRCVETVIELSSRSPLERLVEGEERWKALDHHQGIPPQYWGETELNRSVTCMVLKATANDRRHLTLYH